MKEPSKRRGDRLYALIERLLIPFAVCLLILAMVVYLLHVWRP
jgi:hypothetical protein